MFKSLLNQTVIIVVYFNLQILAKHGSKDDIVGEQKFRSIKLILTVYFDLSVKSFSTGRTSAVGFLKFTMSCVVINILSQNDKLNGNASANKQQ